ncbi:MAG: hypothetical protein DME76_06875 [Verrucomicrobia bacterium]|nr:MAG: hypothetical protein DME76_06875 [Verrucomicrobiota bacterium]
MRGQAGSGVVLLEIDPRTGNVFSARMLKNTGWGILDNAALWVFRQWRFKPGTVSYVRIPISFARRRVR